MCAGLERATLLATTEQRYVVYLHSHGTCVASCTHTAPAWLAREVASEQSDFMSLIVTQVAVVMAERRRMKVHS